MILIAQQNGTGPIVSLPFGPGSAPAVLSTSPFENVPEPTDNVLLERSGMLIRVPSEAFAAQSGDAGAEATRAEAAESALSASISALTALVTSLQGSITALQSAVAALETGSGASAVFGGFSLLSGPAQSAFTNAALQALPATQGAAGANGFYLNGVFVAQNQGTIS